MKTYICIRKILQTFINISGELPEWLMEQFAKLSTSNCRVSSNLTLSANLTAEGKMINTQYKF